MLLKRILLIYFIFSLSISVYSQNKIDSLTRSETIELRLRELENDNIELNSKLVAYKENSSDILDTVSLSITIFMGIFGIVTISQLVTNFRININKLAEIELKLNDEIKISMSETVRKERISFENEIDKLKKRLDELNLMILETRLKSIKTDNVNVEVLDLSTLIDKANSFYLETGNNFYLDRALKGVENHLEIHASIMPYELEILTSKVTGLNGIQDSRANEILNKLRLYEKNS